MDGVVLVLNQDYEPLNVCGLPRAFRLVFGEKAEVVEYDHQLIRSPRQAYRAPSVIRLHPRVRRPRPAPRPPLGSPAVRAAERRLLAVHPVPGRRAQRGVAELPLPGEELSSRPIPDLAAV